MTGSIARLRNARRCPLGIGVAIGMDHARRWSEWPRNARIGGHVSISGTNCLTSLYIDAITISDLPHC